MVQTKLSVSRVPAGSLADPATVMAVPSTRGSLILTIVGLGATLATLIV